MRGLVLLSAGPLSEFGEQLFYQFGRGALREFDKEYPGVIWPTILGLCVVVLVVHLAFGKSLRDRGRRMAQRGSRRLDSVRADMSEAREHLEATEWLLMQMPHASEDAIRKGICGLVDCTDSLLSALRRIPSATEAPSYYIPSAKPDFPELRARVESWELQTRKAAELAVAAAGANNPLSAMRRAKAGYDEASEVLQSLDKEIGTERPEKVSLGRSGF